MQNTRLKYKSITFLYIIDEQVQFEIKNTLPFTLALPPPPKSSEFKLGI